MKRWRVIVAVNLRHNDDWPALDTALEPYDEFEIGAGTFMGDPPIRDVEFEVPDRQAGEDMVAQIGLRLFKTDLEVIRLEVIAQDERELDDHD